MADIEAPVLGEYQVIPHIKQDTMAGSMPYIAKPDIQAGVGFPRELVPDWENVAVKKLGEMVSESRALQVFLDSCVKCGACTDKCHYYLGTSDPKNMPVARQDLLRSVYRRYYTFAGKHFPKLVGARDMTKDVLDEWYN
ncbi:MAG: (Fe-S)-binding protein, partial [Gammaproteobacteria bacterium]|nr:(Fe-S)-binding protein [Gammaproteobacteria bacterium]